MIAIYCRQSADKKDSISIDTQELLCRREAGSEEVNVYCDRGYSGGNTDRPAFQRMLGDIRASLVSKVIIYKLDRISRSLLDFARLMELFREHHVQFQSTQEKFDTSAPIGNAMLSITMVFAQLERETIQQRIRDNYYARGRLGMYLGGKPPFGFRKGETTVEGKKTWMLEENPEEAALVRRVFLWYGAQGLSLGEAARRLNAEEGALVRRFYPGGLGRMLRNPAYVRADVNCYNYFRSQGCAITNPMEDFAGENGCFLYGKQERTLSVALHEGLVDGALFLKVQRRLDGPAASGRLGTGGRSWLSGLIFCGDCGNCMSVTSASHRGAGEQTERYFYFACNGRKRGECTQASTRRGLPVAEVEEAVAEQVARFAREHGALACCASAPSEEHGAHNAQKLRIARAEAEIASLLDAVSRGGGITARTLEERLNALDGELRRAQAVLEENSPCHEREFRMEGLAARWESLGPGDRKRAARCFIRSVEVFRRKQGDLIRIHWRLPFGPVCDTAPHPECITTTDDPCEVFRSIKFPTGDFFPPREQDCHSND